MSGEDWSDQENDAIVARYFSMLAEDLAGRRYNKAANNRDLQQLIGRARGSIEFKHQNISAVLRCYGEEWIAGYKPRSNFQMDLVDAVARWLARHPEWSLRPPRVLDPAGTAIAEAPSLWIGPAPTMRNESPPTDIEKARMVATRLDAAGRDERNRALGRAGEERVFLHERSTLIQIGRNDLARRVRWTAAEDGDGAGYDIASFEPDGSERLIEVKTTNGWERTPFNISRNELAVSEERRDAWCLVRLWNFSRQARAFELRPPLASHVELMPTAFLAKFN